MSLWDIPTTKSTDTGLWSTSTPTPFIKAPTKTVASPSFTALAGGASGKIQTSTPAVAKNPNSTKEFLGDVGNFTKDVFVGKDNTAGATVRNTVLGLPKAALGVGKDIVVGLKDQIVHPDKQQLDTEKIFEGMGGNNIVTKVINYPVVSATKFISRVIDPGLRPFAENIAQIQAINEKGGIADKIAAGQIPPSFLDEIAVLHKTAPQIVGDVAQAVLTAYAGGEGANLAEQGVKAPFWSATKAGLKSGLQAGELFGLSQALSAGQKNPFEILGTVGTSGGAGGVLGAILGGAIPVSKEALVKVREAKIAYDAMTPAERQGGFIKNPFTSPDENHVPLNKEGGIEKKQQQIPLADTSELSHPQEGKEQLSRTSSDNNQQLLKPGIVAPSETSVDFSYDNTIPQGFNPDKYVSEQVAKREIARSVDEKSFTQKGKSFLMNAKTKLVDFTAPIEDVLRDSVSKNNIKLLPSEDIHNQIDRVLRAPTIAGQFAKDNGIIDVIRKIDNPDNLDQYLIAKHAVELDTRGITTGRDIVKDQALIKAYGPKYEADAKIISGYAQKLLDYSVRTGLISKDLAMTLKARYPDYVPFSRVFNELEKANGYGTNAVASLSKQTVVQKIIGSEREIESPLRSLLAKTNDVFKQGEKNVAGRILATYEKLPGNPFELKELKPGESAPHTISFFDGGEKRVFSTTKEIAEAAKALNVQQLNILGKILAAPVRVARLGITGINLPFVGANLVKDQITAFINSNHALNTSIANPNNFIKALFSAVAHDELYREMVSAGGAGTSFDISRNQVDTTFARVRGEVKIPFTDKKVESRILYTVRHPGEFIHAVENIIGRSEEITRIQQYRGSKEALLKKGLPKEEAIIGGARQARESTVNFARHGEWGTVLNNAFLYLNAGIQGTRTLLGNLRDKPIRTGAKIAVSAMFPVAVATAWNLSDPERKKAYDDIAEYEKEGNIIIVPPNPTKDAQGRWNIIKIPLSQEINNLVSLSRRPIEAVADANPLKFKDFSRALLGTVSPIAPDPGSILSAAVPQALKPSLEGVTNKNFFTGIPEVPKSLENLPTEDQVKPYTSGTIRIVAGKFGVSPIKLEAWMKETFGGISPQFLNFADQTLAKEGAIPKDQIGGQSVFDGIAARFSKAQGGQADQKQVDDLKGLVQTQAGERNDLKVEAQKLDRALSAMPKDVANAKVQEVQKNNPQLFAKLKDVVEQRKLDLSYSENLMLQLGVGNGARAKYVNAQIMKLPTSEERNTYLQTLIDKKVVTDQVFEQLKKIIVK